MMWDPLYNEIIFPPSCDSALKRLKTLNLGSCPQLTDNCLPVVKGIWSINLFPGNVLSLLQNVPLSAPELPNLQVLILDGTGITDEGLQIIFNRPPQNLHSLDVSRTAVSHKIFSIVFGSPFWNFLKYILMHYTLNSSMYAVLCIESKM